MATRLVASAARAVKAARRGGRAPFSTQAVAIADDRFSQYSSPVPVTMDHTDILGTPPTKITTLPNGLRVATETRPFAETATIGVWIDAGSRFETKETNGTAHFLEHMIFKGTKRRGLRDIEEGIENMGAHLDAYTSREQTTYYARVLKKDIGGTVDVLADILQNSTFEQKQIDRERGVILREMEEVEKQSHEVLFDHLHATAFQFTSLGRTILGPSENIEKISKADLSKYIATHYTAPRMVLAGAGAIDHDELVAYAKKSFTSLPSDPTTAADLVSKEPSIFTGSEVRIRDDDKSLASVVVAFAGAKWTDADSVPLMVMQNMLGSWNKSAGSGVNMGSELAQLVAANGLAESVMAFNTCYSDGGLFGVTFSAPGEALSDVSWVVMKEMARMVYRVSEDDVVRARNQLKASLVLHLDSTSAVAEDIGRQLLTYGRRMPLVELFARIDAVDAETVKRVAQRFIYDKDVAIAAMGPTQFLPDYNWFRRHTFWLRY